MKNAINGTIVKGLGEGAYFMSMKHYQKEMQKKLGFKAYPGTLNLKVNKKQIDLLKKLLPIKINGFKQKNKAYGGADCYKSKINNVNGSIIVPHLTKHKDVIEFIAPVHLKSELKLKDGDKIKVELI
ncbi:CTP-dependent riboflavin kinase [Candidatus Woesearchaeota archaeon]|nr:CTP-dependent riboflavin kinase [Candidatus Woesearchaeota archaeon]